MRAVSSHAARVGAAASLVVRDRAAMLVQVEVASVGRAAGVVVVVALRWGHRVWVRLLPLHGFGIDVDKRH